MCRAKTRPKCFFVMSPIKVGRFWLNLAYCFLNKFVAKWCKRFPPHLNNVSTLPGVTWNAHCARGTIELLQKETPEFITPQQLLCPPTSPDWNLVDKNVWEILQEKVCKTHITDLELSTTPLTNGCRYDNDLAGPLRSQSLFQFV